MRPTVGYRLAVQMPPAHDARVMQFTPANLSRIFRRHLRLLLLAIGAQAMCCGLFAAPARAQGLGGGAVQGTVKDPTGGLLQAVEIRLGNPGTGFSRTA